ncbi:hypothetical protein L1987_06644 [Smallanthus sonchifolius]|uniref:Uncharacterized protein n=1 Tax=Smallanthus sonchifolius TaxID=185202 RepID=A0ACB9JYX7_9ASTR|nr:hypothetical protein L1987_06644 [Smallanthus sonchifolius]
MECTIPLLVSHNNKQEIEIHYLERGVKSIRRDLTTFPSLLENVTGIMEDQRLIDQSLQNASSHMMEFKKRLSDMERRTAAAEQKVEAAEERAIDAEIRATLAEARVEHMLTPTTVQTGTMKQIKIAAEEMAAVPAEEVQEVAAQPEVLEMLQAGSAPTRPSYPTTPAISMAQRV